MQGIEFNKIIAAVLVALIVSQASNLLGKELVHPFYPAKRAYSIAGISPATTTLDKAPELEPVEPLLAGASIEKGKVVAKKCLQCHTFEKGGPNRIGPNLWNIVGAKHAHLPTFAYTSALKKKEGIWDYQALNAFFHKPRTYVPGTKMAFAGLEKVQDRADLIAYLRTLSDTPYPLPKLNQSNKDKSK